MSIDADTLVERWASVAQAPGLFVLDLRQKLVFADELVAQAFGLPPERARRGMPARHFIAACHPDDVERTKARTWDAKEGFYTQTFRICRPDGSQITARTMGYMFFDAFGPLKRVGTLRIMDDVGVPRHHSMYDFCLAVSQLADEEADETMQYLMAIAANHLAERYK